MLKHVPIQVNTDVNVGVVVENSNNKKADDDREHEDELERKHQQEEEQHQPPPQHRAAIEDQPQKPQSPADSEPDDDNRPPANMPSATITNGLDKPVIEASEDSNGKTAIQTTVPTMPETSLRRPFIQLHDDIVIPQAGTPRANIAPSTQKPNGTRENDWAARHSHQTVLQQHCDFFDRDHDGIIWPLDTFVGFRALGFVLPLAIFATTAIHFGLFYPTLDSWIPDPRLPIKVKNIHRSKHGSDTNTYDHQGRYVPQHFEDVFSKYANGRDYVTGWDLVQLVLGQRCAMDFFGWTAAALEWLAVYIMLWPEDGKIKKEDIRGVYDGSIFYTIAARRSRRHRATGN